MNRTTATVVDPIRRFATLRRCCAGAAVAVAVVAALVGCGSSSTSPGGGSSTSAGTGSSTSPGGGSTSTTGSSVTVKNFMFNPNTLSVPVGTKVTWTFEDSTPHTVKADDGSFSSPALNNGKTYSFTFNKAGTYHYICTIHDYMTGTITVR